MDGNDDKGAGPKRVPRPRLLAPPTRRYTALSDAPPSQRPPDQTNQVQAQSAAQPTQPQPAVSKPANQTGSSSGSNQTPQQSGLIGRRTARYLRFMPKPIKPVAELAVRHRVANKARQIHDDEQVLLRQHKHWIFLAASTALPAALTVVIVAVSLWLTMAMQNPDPLIGLLLAVIPAIVTWLAYYEWWNDEYIVTSRRIIDVRRQLVNLDKRTEIPIEMVQEIRVSMIGVPQRFFNYGDVLIDTASPGLNITFKDIANPRKVKDDIWHAMVPLRQAAQRRREQEQNQKLLAAIMEPETIQSAAHEEREIAIWRRAITTLFWDLLKPAAALTMTILLFVLGLKYTPEYLGIASLVFGAVVLILLGWFIWLYVDWINDEYILTDSRVIEVQRIPFLAEQRIESPLSRVQDVQFQIHGLIEIMLNHGDVIISSASGQIVFHHVENPGEVVQKINEQLKALRKREEDRKFRDQIVTARAAYQAVMAETKQINQQVEALQAQQYRQAPLTQPQEPSITLLPPPTRNPVNRYQPPPQKSHERLMSEESAYDDDEDGGVGPLT